MSNKSTTTRKTIRVPVIALIITEEEIAVRAYGIFQERSQNGNLGDPESDWLEAERQLQAEMKKTRARKPRKTKK